MLINYFRPGDNPNQCAQGYSCPPPSMSLDSFVPIGNRYIDVSAGGPNSFTWSATTNSSWLTLTPTKGSISSEVPEQRVFVSVDWSKVTGSQDATIIFTAVATKQPNLVQTVGFTAVHNTAPDSFKGKVFSRPLMIWPGVHTIHSKDSLKVTGVSPLRLPMQRGISPWTVSPGWNSLISDVPFLV